MLNKWLIVLFFLCIYTALEARQKTNILIDYPLTNDWIDVVIVSHPKDKQTLELCIEGIRQNCTMIRRVIVVSPEPLSEQAEWFNEADFPFTKEQVFLQIGKGNLMMAKSFFQRNRNLGWYYQQLLKLYASFVIPDISSNVLVLDADTVFLNPVDFLNEKQGGLFCVSTLRAMEIYFSHAKRLVPGYKRIHPEAYSVCHHMLFQKAIMLDLFNTVENYHKTPFWKAFCDCVDIQRGGASEYEIYYNFALSHSNQPELRPLKWKNSGELEKLEWFRQEGYHFISFHTYLRK